MPAIPIADSSAPIVVGISATSSEISVVSEIDAAHPRLRGEWHEVRVQLGHVVLADSVLFGEHHDRAALRGLVGE